MPLYADGEVICKACGKYLNKADINCYACGGTDFHFVDPIDEVMRRLEVDPVHRMKVLEQLGTRELRAYLCKEVVQAFAAGLRMGREGSTMNPDWVSYNPDDSTLVYNPPDQKPDPVPETVPALVRGAPKPPVARGPRTAPKRMTDQHLRNYLNKAKRDGFRVPPSVAEEAKKRGIEAD